MYLIEENACIMITIFQQFINPETGKSLGINETGELCVRGPQNMKGYLNNEKATKDMIDEDGWLHTGKDEVFTPLLTLNLLNFLSGIIHLPFFGTLRYHFYGCQDEHLMLVSQQYRAWSDCTDGQAGLALY